MDFEAELEKFQPSLDIEQAEDAIYGNSTTEYSGRCEYRLKESRIGEET